MPAALSAEGSFRQKQRVKQRQRRAPAVREELLQASIVDYLEAVLRHRLVFAIPNAARRTRTGRASNAIPGLLSGAPDLALCLPHGRILWLEVKTASGVLSEQQRQVHQLLLDLGHKVAVVRAVEEVRDVLRLYCVPTREAKA